MPPKGVAVVTGASYGLGACIAKQLAVNAKYEVVLVARLVECLADKGLLDVAENLKYCKQIFHTKTYSLTFFHRISPLANSI